MKFWTSDDEVRKIIEDRKKKFAVSEDIDMYLHVGFFTSSYALAELRLTLLLAKATGITKLQSFDLLTRGMDVRVKIERLKRACENATTLGPNLLARLAIFDGTMRPLRNKISHSVLIPNPDKTTISVAGLASVPDYITPRHPEHTLAETIDMLEIFEYSAWLLRFQKDMGAAIDGAVQRKIFEIDHPLSPLLWGSNQTPGQPKPDARPGSRERKRERKGQPLRGKPPTP